MDYLDDDEFNPRPAPSRPNPVTIVALLAGAGAAALLLWMNLGLSSRVDSLEQTVNNLQQTISKQNHAKELADLSNQLDSVTQALANHLKAQAMNHGIEPGANAGLNPGMNSSSSVANNLPRPTSPAPRALPIRPIPGGTAPAPQHNFNQAPAQNYAANNRGELPPPISRPAIPPARSTPAYSNPSGGWAVNITSVSDAESAYQEVQRLRAMGINAESVRAVSNGRVWYRIRVPGYATHDDAVRARPALEARLGVHDTWVSKRE